MILFVSIAISTAAQIDKTNYELRIKNDDAGEVSNWLNSGDDLGETQSLFLAATIFNKHPKYNFRLAVESTEFAKLNESTSEPRDIYFTELNTFQGFITNNKFKNKHFFYSLEVGLHYIQGNKITIGASGEKYYWHKWVLSRFYNNKYWVYNKSNAKDNFIPFVKIEYGYHYDFYKSEKVVFNTVSTMECQASSNLNYNGIGAKSRLNFIAHNTKFEMHGLGTELELYYLTNFINYQIAYAQLGLQFYFKHFSLYCKLNKPIKKNLDNPFIIYNDMELLFNYGLVIIP